MTEQLNQWAAPKPVDDATVHFGGIDGLMPPYSEVRAAERSKWADWQSEWFFSGLKRYPVPKPGIDLQMAMRHLRAINGSFAPKHEHKQAATAFLANLWFTSPDGEEIKR